MQTPISSRSSVPGFESPCTTDPTVVRRISPRSAISRARSRSALLAVDGVPHARHRTLRSVTDDSLPELRASDADRERTAELLRRAAGEGRLTIEELDERLDVVYETRTQRELDRLTADVVVPDAAGAPRMPVRPGEGGTELARVGDERPRPQGPLAGRPPPEGDQHHGRQQHRPQRRRADRRGHEITVFSLMGGGEVRVPDGINVEVSDFAFMGGNDAKIGDEMPDPGGPIAAHPHDLDHGRQRRQARPQAEPRRAQGARST